MNTINVNAIGEGWRFDIWNEMAHNSVESIVFSVDQMNSDATDVGKITCSVSASKRRREKGLIIRYSGLQRD